MRPDPDTNANILTWMKKGKFKIMTIFEPFQIKQQFYVKKGKFYNV